MGKIYRKQNTLEKLCVLTSQQIAVLFDVSEDIVSSLKTQQKSHISLEKYGSLFDLKNYLKTWLQI